MSRLNRLFADFDAADDYKLVLKSSVASTVEAIEPEGKRRKIRGRISALAREPRPAGAQLLPGYEDRYRLPVDRYRIVYGVDDDSAQVVVFAVARRRC